MTRRNVSVKSQDRRDCREDAGNAIYIPEAPSYLNSRLLGYVTIGCVEP